MHMPVQPDSWTDEHMNTQSLKNAGLAHTCSQLPHAAMLIYQQQVKFDSTVMINA